MRHTARLRPAPLPEPRSGLDENDPKSMAQFMRRMGRELGEDSGPEFEEALSELEQAPPGALGESPDESHSESAVDCSSSDSEPAL